MKNKKSLLVILGLLILCIVAVGCKDILISGTFIFVKTFDFTAQGGIYYESIDITTDPDWNEHKEKIDFVDAVGVEFFITSTEAVDVTFDAYIDDYAMLLSWPASIPGSATQIIDSLVVPPGVTHVTYKQSLGFLVGLEELKTLSKLGMFNYYGESTGNDGSTFIIDSAKIIVTLSASE